MRDAQVLQRRHRDALATGRLLTTILLTWLPNPDRFASARTNRLREDRGKTANEQTFAPARPGQER
jgi:hypothetical protein